MPHRTSIKPSGKRRPYPQSLPPTEVALQMVLLLADRMPERFEAHAPTVGIDELLR
jgi:hypothetical protein